MEEKYIVLDKNCINIKEFKDFINRKFECEIEKSRILIKDKLLDGNYFFRSTIYMIFNHVLFKLISKKYIRLNNVLEFKLYRLLLIKFWVELINKGDINLSSLYKFYKDEKHFEYFYFMLNYYCADAICTQLSPLSNLGIKDFNLKNNKLDKLIDKFLMNRICYGVISNFEFWIKRRNNL